MAENSSRRWWALVAIAASVLVVGLDLTVLNLALPTIAVDLHASTSDLQWISDSYSLVLAAAMLPAGMLGDRLGRKKVLLVALVFGATIGVAILGTVLNSVYRGRLDVTGLPTAVANAAKSSVVAGVAVADKLGSAALLDSVRHAFVAGMDTMLWICGGIALVSAILAVIFLPRRAEGAARPAATAAAPVREVAAAADVGAGEAARSGQNNAQRAE
jgi:MFS family permease